MTFEIGSQMTDGGTFESAVRHRLISRRSAIWSGLAATAAFSVVTPTRAYAKVTDEPIKDFPFTLGVASGDPLPDAVVIWTRLAPEVFAPFGGLGTKSWSVHWQVADDADFHTVRRSGVATAHPEFNHTVHVDVQGLRPGADYYYRFRVGEHISQVGRTKTAPPPHQRRGVVDFGFVSCMSFGQGYFTALSHLAEDRPDVVLSLGDYIYEYGVNPHGDERELTEPLPDILTDDARSLDRYRLQYSLYKSDPDLMRAHEASPWLFTWDDHEVVNDYGGPYQGTGGDSPEEYHVRRANAYRAFWENVPMRIPHPTSPDLRIYQQFDYGRLAQFSLLDTRQYRDAPLPGPAPQPDSPARRDPDRQMLGATQEEWLLDGLTDSRARWKIVPQGVVMSQMDEQAGEELTFQTQPWDGYFAARQRIMNAVHERDIDNLVVLTGDAHTNYAFNMLVNYDEPDSPGCGVELVGTSVASGGNGEDMTPVLQQRLDENPHLVFANQQRGYVLGRATSETLEIDYKIVPYVLPHGAGIEVRKSFVVENGKPELNDLTP